MAPKIRQKKVFQKVMENNGKSVSQAMKESGYPDTTARNPQQITRSKGWQELVNQYLPDKLLTRQHKKLLNKTKVLYKKDEHGNVMVDSKGYAIPIETKEIDKQAVKGGLQLAYKIKDKMSPEQQIIQHTFLSDYQKYDDDELEAIAAGEATPDNS